MNVFICNRIHTSTFKIGHRHSDMRQAWSLFPRMVQLKAAWHTRADQQQAGNELRRAGRIDGNHIRRFAHGRIKCGRSDCERQTAFFTVVFNGRAQLPQAIQHRFHRAGICLLIAIEIDGTIGEQRKSRHETHHRAGKSAVNFRIAMEVAIRWRRHRYRRISFDINLTADAKRT